MTTDPKTDFVCACGYDANFVCKGEPYFNELENKQYCVLHYPQKDKIAPFRAALKKKIEAEDFNFSSVWFPEEANFQNFTFSEGAEFDGATFSEGARFDDATFSEGARFINTTFDADANFFGTTFCKDVYFLGTVFCADAKFNLAIFNSTTFFKNVKFGADTFFHRATFKSYVNFDGSVGKRNLGENPRLSFQFAHLEKPERVSFHTLDLHPHWFVNVDSRKFEFTDVEFKYVLKDELKSLEEMRVSAPHRLLAVAFRQLADNAETNHRYREASRLRYSAFEVRRIEKSHGAYFWQMDWWRRQASCYKESLELTFSGFVPWRLDWWYWLASGYGESVGRAFIVFTLLISLFAFGYKSAEFEPPSKSDIQVITHPSRSWSEALRYSINVALLQKPDPKPRGGWGWLVTAETILGPAQAALLALALRRRFMR